MDKKIEQELSEIVKNNYSLIADHYSETRKKVLWESLFELVEDISDGAKVLDVGCGSGKLLQAFSDKKIDYLGIDSSEELLENAGKNFSAYNFVKGNIMDLDSFDNDYNFVFCIAVLQHIPDRKNRVEALRQLKNRLSSGGKIILSVWDMRSNSKYRKMLFNNFILKIIGKNKMDFGDIVFDWKNSKGEKVSKRYYHAYKLNELRKDCANAGLVVVELYKKDYNIYAVMEK